MLDSETKRRIDTARDILVGKIPDPKSQIEQITIALITFRKIIDEGNFTALETNPAFSMKDLEDLNGWREDLINYVRDYVNLNVFAGVA